MNNLSSFYFLRHGQTDWNKQRLCQGQNDVQLNATGLSQAHDAKAILAGVPIATVCSSPLGRARQTAEIINESLNCPLVIIDGLQECYFGNLEGKPVTTDTYSGLLADAENWGGEKRDEFIERVVGAVKDSLEHPGPVLVVAHGGAYWALQERLQIENGQDIAKASPVYLRAPENDEGKWSVNALS